jgi:aminopeptidase N
LSDNRINESVWIVANLKRAGFYRVNYDPKNWDLLAKQLTENNALIDTANRAQLLDDSFNLGRAEVVHQTLFLDMISYLNYELDPLPFKAALNGLEYLEAMLSSNYVAYTLFKVSPQIKIE